jgi:ATP-dependent RNA helicase DDX55/SPB4
VDWIIQFDPPQDPSTFVHRVGRTARNGADGNALVFLMPNEEAYIDYLAQKDISMKEMEVTLGLPSILPKIKYEIKKR